MVLEGRTGPLGLLGINRRFKTKGEKTGTAASFLPIRERVNPKTPEGEINGFRVIGIRY
jgi:hypothetical protein